MDSPEKLAPQGTQDKETLENTESEIKNGQSGETGTIGYTRQRNAREYRKCNQKWTVRRNWHHRVHKTKKRQGKPKVQSKMNSPEKMAPQGTQDKENQIITPHHIGWTPL